MELGGKAIEDMLRSGDWKMYDGDGQITDETRWNVGPNSVDVTLGPHVLQMRSGAYMDHGKPCSVKPQYPSSLEWNSVYMGDMDGMNHSEKYPSYYVLDPGEMILGHTRERFDTDAPVIIGDCPEYFVQQYDGRSTCGRIGLMSHITAGYGDYGFKGFWTLELVNMSPLRIMLLSGMRIGQIHFTQVHRPKMYAGAYNEPHYGPVPPVLGPGRF